MEALAAHPSPTIQHRAVFLLRNLIVCGGSEIARDMIDSHLIELIDYLQHLPDISDTEVLPPEAIVLGQVSSSPPHFCIDIVCTMANRCL